MNVKIRNKFIEIKYRVSNGLFISDFYLLYLYQIIGGSEFWK